MKLSLSAIMTQMMSDLQNSVTRPLIIVFIHLFSAYHQRDTFGAVSVKLSLNRITAQNVTSLQNTVRRHIIIVLSLSCDAYNAYDAYACTSC